MPANYKWIVLSNTTIGMLLATLNSSILLIVLHHLPAAQAATLTGRSFFLTS